MDFGVRGIGGPPPTYHGKLDKWDDWSWQLKRYVGLYKPLAKTMMDEIETSAQKAVTDSLCEAYDVQQTGTQNNQLSLFSKQLAYMLAQITDGAARAIVRNEDTENGICESAGWFEAQCRTRGRVQIHSLNKWYFIQHLRQTPGRPSRRMGLVSGVGQWCTIGFGCCARIVNRHQIRVPVLTDWPVIWKIHFGVWSRASLCLIQKTSACRQASTPRSPKPVVTPLRLHQNFKRAQPFYLP